MKTQQLSKLADPFTGLGYKNGEITKFGDWWLCGKGMQVRYFVGEIHECFFGYDPECAKWPYRLARWMHLSGY